MVNSRKKYSNYINYRSPLKHTYDCLMQDNHINIVYFGGSVTAGYGSTDAESKSWRALSVKWFRDKFPDAVINDIHAAIGESGSYLGTYRLERDVLSQNPDLVFIEFAVNDYFNGATRNIAGKQYETIIREIKREFPLCDIVTLIAETKDTAESVVPYPAALGYERISYAYDIPMLFVGKSLVDSMNKGKDEWDKYFIDIVHPNDLGYKQYYCCVEEFLHNSLLCSGLENLKLEFKELRNVVSRELLDGDRKYLICNEEDLKNSKGFLYSDEIYKNLPNTPYVGYIYTDRVDAEYSCEFYGTEISIYSNFYENSSVKVSVDGGDYMERVCSAHNPTLIAEGLEPGKHTVKIMPVFSGDFPKVFKLIAILTRNSAKSSKRYLQGTAFIPKNKEKFFN